MSTNQTASSITSARNENFARIVQWLGSERASVWIPILLFIAAVIVRVICSPAYPLIGDDVSSLTEAKNLGLNFQGLPYLFILHFWQMINDGELWLRIPSIVIGALAVPVCWLWLRQARGPMVALLASLLFIFSTQAITTSVQVRYYSLFLLAATAFFWRYWVLVVRPRNEWTRWQIASLILVGLVLILSQLFGIVVVGLVVLHAIVWYRRYIPRWILAILVGGAVLLGILVVALLVSPSLMGQFFGLISRLTNSILDSTASRGFSLVTFAKIGYLFFVFSLGSYVYPLNLAVVVPGLLISAGLVLAGIYVLFRAQNKLPLTFALIVGLGSIIVIYVAFDALLPTSFLRSADPSLIVFALPIFVELMAESVTLFAKRPIGVMAIFVVAIGLQVLGLAYLPTAQGRSDVTVPLDVIQQTSTGSSMTIVADGRAGDELQYYLRNADIPVKSAVPAEFDGNIPTDKAVFMSFDQRDEIRCSLERTLNYFTGKQQVYSWINYPLFIYLYDLKSAPSSREVLIPHSIYGPEFADLRLPQQVNWENQNWTISGMYSLPTCDKVASWNSSDSNLPKDESKALVLFSNLLPTGKAAAGTAIAHISVVMNDGSQTGFDIRKGNETAAWDDRSCDCQVVLTWHKRMALVGSAAFPQAYSDFTAKVWGITLPLPNPGIIKSIEISALRTDTPINIWGLMTLAK